MDEARFANRAVRNGLAFALIVLFVALDLLSIRHKSVTYDEPSHLYYGLRILAGNSDRFSDSKAPFSALNALAAADVESADSLRAPEKLLAGLSAPRAVTIFFSAGLGWLVFCWSRALYGFQAAMLSLALYAFCPNIQAHSRWVTTDLYAAAAGAAFLYAFWKFRRGGEARWGAASALALGLAPLAKPTLVYLYLAAPLLWAVPPQGADSGRRGESRWAAPIWATGFIVSSLAVINAGYLFNGFGDSLNAYQFRSAAFQRVQSASGALGDLPVPLPRPFLEGLDWTRYNEVSGANRGSNYLLGETRNGPFRWYYVVAYVFKAPLAIQILILAAFGFRLTGGGFRRDELFLIVPALLYFILVAFASSAQLGIRLLLPMFPLLYVFCGSLLEKPSEAGLRRRIFVGALTAWLAVSSLSYFPHYLSYFNELIGDRKSAFRVLADSNLDWGQNERYADDYIRRHPSTAKNPTVPTAGRIAVTANYLTGVLYLGAAFGSPYAKRPDPNRDPNLAWPRWLRRNLSPVDHIAYSYLIFEVPPERLKELGENIERGDGR